MFNPKTFANSRPDGVGALEIISENGHRPRLFVPLKRTELSGEVTGPLASLRLTQIYGYSKEQCDRTLEAAYRFPLPGDAAVTGVRVSFGEIEIVAELKERGQAETDYEEAVRTGRQAALATRESPDVFTLRVAGIQPDQEIKVETSYAQLARADGAGWSLRIPLTTAPRYVRGDELDSRHAQGQPLALLRDPGHRFALDIIVHGASEVESGTHHLATSEENGAARVRLRDGETVPDRDCLLTWRPRREADAAALQVFLADDPESGQVYFLALVSPQSARDGRQSSTREAILLVDHSGSMEGAKWEAADWAVKSFLYGLSQRDTFGLGLFHSTTKWFDRKTRQADGPSIEKAIDFLTQNRDSGGTELGVALEQALSLTRSTGEGARHVLIITDAEVSDAGRILRLADEESRRDDRRRISVLCIDAAPNSHLAMELAERGGGVAKFLTSDPEQEDISTALDEALADWAEPVLTGLRLEVNSPVAQAAGREVRATQEPGWSGIDLGDLPGGRSVWVIGRAPRNRLNDFAVKLTRRGHESVTDCRVEIHRIDKDQTAIKALFGARRVLGVEYLMNSGYAGDALNDQLARLGYDPGEVLAPKQRLYAENARVEVREALRDLLAREALDYGLACAETAFVAVRKEAGRLIDDSVAVANALPDAWSETFTGSARARGITLSSAAPPPAAPTPAPARASRPIFSLSRLRRAARKPASDTPVMDWMELAEPAAPVSNRTTLFSGNPQGSGETILFDSTRDQAVHPAREAGTINRLIVSFAGGAPDAKSLGAELCLLVFVGDMATPRAKVKLADLVRQGGARPLNLSRKRGEALRLTLADPAGVWSGAAPQIEIALEWA
jgi:Ca-activated chloride channel homolog